MTAPQDRMPGGRPQGAQSGFILIFSILMLLGISTLAIGMVYNAHHGQVAAQNYKNRMRAFFAADGMRSLLAQEVLDGNAKRYIQTSLTGEIAGEVWNGVGTGGINALLNAMAIPPPGQNREVHVPGIQLETGRQLRRALARLRDSPRHRSLYLFHPGGQPRPVLPEQRRFPGQQIPVSHRRSVRLGLRVAHFRQAPFPSRSRSKSASAIISSFCMPRASGRWIRPGGLERTQLHGRAPRSRKAPVRLRIQKGKVGHHQGGQGQGQIHRWPKSGRSCIRSTRKP